MKLVSIWVLLLASVIVAGMAAALVTIHPAPVHAPTPTVSAAVAVVDLASTPTQIQVYVLARGGKFIGDDVGGSLVTLHDARTGEFIASGKTSGGSGLPDLMSIPRVRTASIPTTDASVYTATVSLAAPRLVEVEAYGPLGAQGAANHVRTTEWVLPQAFGQNKIILEIPGLNVDILNPPTHGLPKTKPPLDIPLRANVTMMCGCPIAPDTAWKPEEFAVKALVTKPDGTQDVVDLTYDANAPDGAPSQFIATYNAEMSGIYNVNVVANQAAESNSGSDTTTFIMP